MGWYEDNIAATNRSIQAANAAAQQQSYISQIVRASNQANAANTRREQQATAIYDEIINRYQPGGSFETKSLAELERLKKRSVTEQFGQSEQQAISGGMSGVQRPTRAGMGMKWEEKVGAPARLSLEDVLMQRLSGAQQNKASFIEGIQDTGPSLSDIFSMAQAGQFSADQYSAPSSEGLPSMQEFGANITGGGTGGTGGSVKGTGIRYTGGAEVGKSLWASQGTQVNTGGSTSQVSSTSTGGSTNQNIMNGYDTSGWTDAEKRAWAEYVPGKSGYNVPAAKRQQKVT